MDGWFGRGRCVQGMKSVRVTTLAGSGVRSSEDGIGTAGSFDDPSTLSFDVVSGGLVIGEEQEGRIRYILPATEEKKLALKRALDTALVESGSIPIPPLVFLIFDYAAPNSTPASCVCGFDSIPPIPVFLIALVLCFVLKTENCGDVQMRC